MSKYAAESRDITVDITGVPLNLRTWWMQWYKYYTGLKPTAGEKSYEL